MAEYKAALINEVEKLYKKKKVVVAAALSLLVIILGQVALIGLRSGFGVRGVSGSEFPLLVLSFVVNSIIPLFTALVAIDSFSGEYSQNTMKVTLTRPITRLKLFTAKLLAVMIFVMVNLMLVMILSTITGLIFNFNTFSAGAIGRILASYAVTLMPLLVFALVIVFFTSVIKSGTGVFFVSILVFMVFKGLEIIFSSYSGLFFTSMMDWYKLWIMQDISIAKIFRQFMMMCSYVILLFTGSYYLFDKKDF